MNSSAEATILPTEAKEIGSSSGYPFAYTICTLVSRPKEYAEMLESFITAGFNSNDCEFLYIDNSQKNQAEAFSGLNRFLQAAKGKYVILCHQDILLNYDNRSILEKRIEEIEKLDKNWAIIGNAGAAGIKNIIYRITEGDGVFRKRGQPPAKVVSVDENFILVKKEANLSLSADLKGFHFYGTDLCLLASMRGYTSYVINFHLTHKSKGNIDKSFYVLREEFRKKYEEALTGRHIQTTCTKFYISGSPFMNWLMNTKFIMFWSRQYFKIKFRKEIRRKITD